MFTFILGCVVAYSFSIYTIDFLLLVLFVITILFDLYLQPKKLFLNLLIYLTIFLNIFGVFTIEYSIDSYYLYEIEQWTGYSGSIPLLLLVQFAFIQGINFVLNENKIPNNFGKKISYKHIFLLLLGFLLLFTYSLIIIHKPAPVLGVDRFVYDKEILGSFGRVTNLLFYFSLGLGILYFKEKKKLYLILLFFIEIAFFLKGHKFWNFVQILFLFFIPYVMYINKEKILKTFLSFTFLIFIFIFGAIKINLYYFPSFEPLDYVKQRLSQEGQLWWSTYTNYPDNLRLDEAASEFNTYFHLNEENKYDIGMYKAMYLNTTPERFEWKIAKLSRYVYSTPALLYYYFGSIGVIFILWIFGMLWGLWLQLVLYVVSHGNLLASILVGRLFYILRKVVKDGDFYKFFSIEFLLILVALGVLLFIPKMQSYLKTQRILHV